MALYVQDALYTMIPKVLDLLEEHGDHSQDDEPPTHKYALHSKKLKAALSSDLQSLLTHSRGKSIEATLDQCPTARYLCRFREAIFDSNDGRMRGGRPSDRLHQCGPPQVADYIKEAQGFDRRAVSTDIIDQYEDVVYVRELIANIFKKNPDEGAVHMTKVATGQYFSSIF